MANIGDLVVNLSMNSTRFKRASISARRTLKDLRRSALQTGGAVAAIFSGRAAINAAREQIQAERKLEAVIRATGGAAGFSVGEIKAYAAELQKVTNFGDEVTISAAGMLATFKNIRGDQFKEVLALAQDLSAVVGQDLKSSVLQLGKAFDDPIKGAGALKRVGVSLSEEEMERIKLLQKQGDIVQAQVELAKVLKGQFAGAAQEMADPITQASNAMGDIGEALGAAIIELANAKAGAENFNETADAIIGGIKVMTLGMKRFGVLVTDIFKNIGALAGTIFANIGNNLSELVGLAEKVATDPLNVFNAFEDFEKSVVSPLDGFTAAWTDLSKVTLDLFRDPPKPKGPEELPVPPGIIPEDGDLFERVKDNTSAAVVDGFQNAGELLGGDQEIIDDAVSSAGQFAGSAQRGSAEAFSTIAQNVFGKRNSVDKTADNTAKMLEEQKQTNNILQAGATGMGVVPSFT